MVFVRSVMLIGLLFVAMACSKKGGKSPSNNPPPVEESQEPRIPPSKIKDILDEPVVTPPPQNQVTEENVDIDTSNYISEIKKQISQDPVSHEKRIKNVEFANRISQVDFDFSRRSSHLSLVTHSAKTFYFELVSRKDNVLYFNAYENKKDFLDKSIRATIYSAEVTIISNQVRKTIAVIRIKDIETTAIVNVFYVRKTGYLFSVFLPSTDYKDDLTKTSRVFLQRLTENPHVEGSFYSVITEERNISSASKFKLIISDNFTLESAPILDSYRSDQPNLVPLQVDYKNFWKIFFFGSTAYKVIKEASYIIESPRNPVELTALNLQLKIEGKEKIKGLKNSLPLQFHINLE